MGPIRVEVTQEDIDKGIPERCRLCPVARAVCRALDITPYSVSVDGAYISVIGTDYETPAAVNEFIDRFDEGQPVEPFFFLLGDGS